MYLCRYSAAPPHTRVRAYAYARICPQRHFAYWVLLYVCMYVKIRRHQHTRVHAHTGPRRHTRAPACHRHHIPRLSAGRHSTQTTIGSPSLCDRPRGGGGIVVARSVNIVDSAPSQYIYNARPHINTSCAAAIAHPSEYKKELWEEIKLKLYWDCDGPEP